MNLIVRAWHAGKPTDTHAIRSMFQTVAAAVRTLQPHCIVFALDGGHVHRSKMLPSYKAHRPPHDPNLIAQIKLAEEAIKVAGLNAVRVTNWEADDVLASIVERSANVVICSSDKDLLALHGRCRIYHPWGTGTFVDPETKLGIPAGQVTDYLAMCGDTSDGVPGIKGIGPKTASELLKKFGSLEAIIVAARTGRIPGAAGKKISEQNAAALLCQDVIQLRASLPIPELPPWTPPTGYQTALQSIGLGSVAAILEGIHNVAITLRRDEPPATIATERKTPLTEETSSAATTQAEQVENDESGRRGLPDSATLPDQRSQVEGRSEPAHITDDPRANSTENSQTQVIRPGKVAGTSPVSGADNFITRSITEPIRTGLTFDQKFSSPESSLITYWEAGRRAAGRQPSVENPFKPATQNAIAWQQGCEGCDLSVVLSDEPAVLNLKSQISNPPASRSLFE